MAIIYTYPRKSTPVLADTILLNDSEDANKTKTATLQSLANVIDDTVTLQEVLNVGRTAYYSFSTAPQQYASIQLGRTDGAGSNPLDTVVVDGQTGNITMSAGQHGSTADLVVGGSTTLGVSPLVFNSAGTELTVGGADFHINATGSNDLEMTSWVYTVNSGSNMFINSAANITLDSAGGSDITLDSHTGDIISDCEDFIVDANNDIKLESTGSYIDLDTTGEIRIGLAPSRPSGIKLATDGDITITHNGSGVTTSNGNMELADGAAANPSHSFAQDNETGMYLITNQELGFAAAGVNVIRAKSTIVDTKPVIRAEEGIALQNSAAVPDPDETMIRFAQGEFECEFFDVAAAVPGLTYTGNSGTWQLINDRITGSGRIYVTGGAAPFAATLGVGNFEITAGPPSLMGQDLLTAYPPSLTKAPGNISISEATGFANNPLLVPVAGVSVAGTPSYFSLKTYTAPAADLQLINSIAANWANGIILTFDFSYNIDPA